MDPDLFRMHQPVRRVPAPPSPPPAPSPLRTAVEREIRGGNYSIRGMAHRYGVSRPYIRLVLWRTVPEYMRDYEQRHGRDRLTNRDHAGNRARRRGV